MEDTQALARAVERVLAEGRQLATREGLTFATAEGAQKLRHVFYAVRGELAAKGAMAQLQRAGLATPQVQRTLEALKALGQQSEAWAKAWSAVARRAAPLPPEEARLYLEAVESLRAVARPAAQGAVAELLYGSGLAKHPPRQFLRDLSRNSGTRGNHQEGCPSWWSRTS